MTRSVFLIFVALGLPANTLQAEDTIPPARARYARTVGGLEHEIVRQLEKNWLSALEKGDAEKAKLARDALFVLVHTGIPAGESIESIPETLSIRYEQTRQFEREQLIATYAEVIEDEKKARIFDITKQYETELQLIERGTALPSLIDAQPDKFRTGRFTWSHGGHLHSIENFVLPDVLRISSQLNRFQVEGVRVTDEILLKGRTVGHLGKIVLAKMQSRAGFLCVTEPTGPDSTSYFLVVTQGDEVILQHLVWLKKHELYRWNCMLDEDGFVKLELHSETKLLARLRVREADDLWFGFAATVRHQDERAGLSVLFLNGEPREETSP